MKRRPTGLVLVLLALGLFVAGCGREQGTKTEYYCPMHPTYVSDRPGDCPICNMRLVPRAAAPAPAPSAGPEPGRRVLYYRSPMDPQVTSKVPAKDPMGMEYVPVYADEAAPATGVEGHATLTLAPEAQRLAGVQTVVVGRERLARRVRTVGIVKANETLLHHVHVKLGGFVEKLYVNTTGQRVYAGDPVFEFYSPELLASQEEYLRARRALEAMAPAALPETREAARDLLQSARKRLELFDVPQSFLAQLERTGVAQRTVTMLSHASGYVTMKDVIEGQRVEPGSELFTISDLSRVWIEADFYENEANLVRVGETAMLALPYDPGKRLTGRVTYVYPYFDAQTRTLKVRFEVANPDLALKPSMYVDVSLEVEAPEGVVVPESAVLDSGSRQLVFVALPGDRFEPRRVTVGLRSEGRVQILSGVDAGESVVVRANFLLDSESRLRGAIRRSGAAPGGGTP